MTQNHPLPKGWHLAPLSSVGKWGSGGTPTRTNPKYYDNGTIPWLVIGDLNEGYIKTATTFITEDGLENSSAKLLQKGTLLVAMYGSIGKTGITALPCATNQAIAHCTPNEGINLHYLHRAIQNIKPHLISLGKGGTQQNISQTILKDQKIPLPPTNEQRRIADKLDRVLARVDTANEHLSRVAPLIKRFRQSVLSAATSGRLTEDWRKNKLQEWKCERADAICAKVQSGGTPKAGFSPQGTPFLKVYNIVNQRIDFDYKPQFIAQEVHEGELKKSITLPDDVLMNIVGPPLGKVAIVSSTSPSWNINQAITLFRPSERILSKWIYIVLCEGTPIRSVLKSTKGSVGQVNISLSQCRAFSIPVPSIEEQSEIIRRVEKLFAFADRLEERLSQAQAAVQKLTPALLAKAFRGELVPQDPNDEPASELLKRLQESRTESAKPSRARKPRTRKSP